MKTIIVLILLTTLFSCTKNQEEQVNKSVESPLKACSKEAKMCADGQVVGRNPIHSCNFDPCPNQLNLAPKKKNSEIFCTADVKQCPDGTFVGRDANNNCQFRACTNGNLQ